MAFTEDPQWYKDAVIYEVHVKAFYDANDDGIGDFRGLIEKLDYLEELGVNTLWVLPFYPSPLRDDGYDISDYRNVLPEFGTRQDVRTLIRELHRRDMRLITELVINHTSDQHPWFQAARRAQKGTAKRDFYVWSDSNQRFADTRIIFTDAEKSNWAWDDGAGAYFWHRFFSHQPDLNFDNPSVVKAVIRTMRFWLDMGVDGLRLDAIPYLVEREGTNNENLPETHAVIRRIRAEVDAHYGGRMLLAEANQWPEDVREYFGDGDECHMAYHFPIMPRMYMALAQEDRYPIVDILRQTPPIPDSCQWAIFLRNHDELTLEMVTDRERDYMYSAYANDPRMRVNLGIRRRLATLMGNDRDKIQLMNCLLMSLPGSPIVYYGDEIGMGDNIYLGDRNAVRTPMQWSPDRNAGFSRADPQRLYLPPVMDPIYGYQAVNVEAQTGNASSLLHWMRRLIAVRRSYPAFGRGTIRVLGPGNRRIFSFIRSHEGTDLLCVANLSHAPQAVELGLADFKGRVPVELNSRTSFPPIGDLPYLLTLPRYGFLWFELSREAPAPVWHTEAPGLEDLPMLVLTEPRGLFTRKAEASPGVDELVSPLVAAVLRDQALPRYFAAQRWFSGGRGDIARMNFEALCDWETSAGRWLFALATVQRDSDGAESYFLPLAVKWGMDAQDIPVEWFPRLLSRVRRKAEVGVLLDAAADDDFCRTVVEALGHTREIPLAGGRLRFLATRAYHDHVREPVSDAAVAQPPLRQNHTVVRIGGTLLLKLFRRIEPGINAEWETGRFLTEHTHFDRVPPTLGALFCRTESQDETLLAILHGYVDNQGTAWEYTQGHLGRSLEGLVAGAEPEHTSYGALMHTLGRRLAEMHEALAVPSIHEAFGREKVDAGWAEGLRLTIRDQALATLDQLHETAAAWTDAPRDRAEALMVRREDIAARCTAFDFGGLETCIVRCHGDFQLDRVLVAENDVYFVGLEGPPGETMAARRARHSPLIDVAGLLCSLAKAARVARARLPAETPGASAALDQGLARWEAVARREFLAGYRQVIGNSPVVPAQPRHTTQLIALFALERMLRELRAALHEPAEQVLPAIDTMLAWLSPERAIEEET